MTEEYTEQLRSNFADLANIGGREGGAITAYEHSYYMADMLIPPAASQTPSP